MNSHFCQFINQFSIPVHLEQNITATNKFSSNKYLRNSGPICEVLDTYTIQTILKSLVCVQLSVDQFYCRFMIFHSNYCLENCQYRHKSWMQNILQHTYTSTSAWQHPNNSWGQLQAYIINLSFILEWAKDGFKMSQGKTAI